MAFEEITFSVSIAALAIGSFTDFKKREVPDWLSYGMVIMGLGLSLLFSVLLWDITPLLQSLAGFIIFLGFAFLMFYSGQWGGGDSKVLMGLGALIGLDWTFSKAPFLLSFFVNMLLAGAAYGLLWSTILIGVHFKKFRAEVKKILLQKKVLLAGAALTGSGMLLFIARFFLEGNSKFLASILTILLFSIFILWIFLKAVEKACMVKKVTPLQLTEGDWIVKNINHQGKYICGPKDLGIEKKAIRQLVTLFHRGKIRHVLIKEGIPFVPSFLLAFIITLWKGNLFLLLVGI
ncbi:prepilin peptidase [Candidatus Woesearchaeota archaeon]|nr:prepilin peptidase [Candidatus Woesearchaeota archaeon]